MIDRKNLFIIATCVLIVSTPLLRPSISYGLDHLFHVARMVSIAEELPKFPIYIYPSWIFDFGEPVGIFYPSLFLYPFAILLKLGFSIVFVNQILFILIIILAAVCTFIAGKFLFDDNRFATIFSICYITAWYFQQNIFARSDVGESIAMAFIPLALISSRCMLNRKIFLEGQNWIITVLAYTGLIQSHILTTVMFCMLLLAFWIFEVIKSRSFDVLNWKIFTKILLTTLGLNAFFIIPFLDFYSTVPVNISVGQSLTIDAKDSRYVWKLFRYSGAILLPFVIIMFWTIIAGQIDSRSRKIFLGSFLIGIFFCFMATKNFPWAQIESFSIAKNFLSKFQFPWRFMCIGTFFLSIFGALSLYQFKHRWKLVSIACILMSAWSITIGARSTFVGDERYGWFWRFSAHFSDDVKSVIIDKYTLHPFDYLKKWRESPHDPRIQSVEIENGMARIFFKSDEEFTASVPIANCYSYDVLFGDTELPYREGDWSELLIDFPAGEGVVTVQVARIDSLYDDYLPRGVWRDSAKAMREAWDSGFEPRVTKISRRDGKIFVEYDLSKAESNLEGNSKIELPIFYFPGFESSVEIESSERHLIQIDPKNLDSRGIIEISYEGLPSFKIANIISLATLIFLLIQLRRRRFRSNETISY